MLSVMLSQSIEREVDALTQRICAWRISGGEDASAVLAEEGVVILHSLILWLQHFASLVPIDFAEAGIDGFGSVTSVAQMVVEEAALLEPDRRAARVR